MPIELKTIILNARPHSPETDWAIDAARTATNQLGFIPGPTIRHFAAQEMLAVLIADGLHSGFILHEPSPRRSWQQGHIYMVYVRPEQRRKGLATCLVIHALQHHILAQATSTSCWVATDLTEAMAFWPTLHFKPAGTRQGGRARQRTHQKFQLDHFQNQRYLSHAFKPSSKP